MVVSTTRTTTRTTRNILLLNHHHVKQLSLEQLKQSQLHQEEEEGQRHHFCQQEYKQDSPRRTPCQEGGNMMIRRRTIRSSSSSSSSSRSTIRNGIRYFHHHVHDPRDVARHTTRKSHSSSRMMTSTMRSSCSSSCSSRPPNSPFSTSSSSSSSSLSSWEVVNNINHDDDDVSSSTMTIKTPKRRDCISDDEDHHHGDVFVKENDSVHHHEEGSADGSTTTSTSTSTSPHDSSGTTSTKSTSDSSNDDSIDYLTNGGIVEGVWMFCRHGDRTPSRCLMPANKRDDEASYWMTKLPTTDSASAYEQLSIYYPLCVPDDTNDGKFIDVGRNPYGFLTLKGVRSLKENGIRFFNRYNNLGYHCPTGSSSSSSGVGTNIKKPQQRFRREYAAEDFLDVWDMSVYSTNYLRTILSCQSFLDGLLNTNAYQPRIGNNNRPHDPTISRELRVPKHSWIIRQRPSVNDTNTSTATHNNTNTNNNNNNMNPLVNIQVRSLQHDPLNAFDRNPKLMSNFIDHVMKSDQFIQGDNLAVPLASRLANVLPGLVRPFRTTMSHRSPSGINWVEAADHFVCRRCHDVPYTQFTDFENDIRIEQYMNAISHQVIAHLSWRFRRWYQHPPLLAAIAAPPLREVANQIIKTPDLSSTEQRPFVIYSCHDITILGLLYGIGTDFLAPQPQPPISNTTTTTTTTNATTTVSSSDAVSQSLETTDTTDTSSSSQQQSQQQQHQQQNQRWRSFWPPYGSHLIFELVRIRGESGSPASNDSHVVRILLNGKPIRSVHVEHDDQHDDESDHDEGGQAVSQQSRRRITYAGYGPQHMLYVEDFLNVVSKLEKDGGLDYESLSKID